MRTDRSERRWCSDNMAAQIDGARLVAPLIFCRAPALPLFITDDACMRTPGIRRSHTGTQAGRRRGSALFACVGSLSSRPKGRQKDDGRAQGAPVTGKESEFDHILACSVLSKFYHF